jgi:endonuclease/exonuclease/phosphatase family metal-dependent hydrolase
LNSLEENIKKTPKRRISWFSRLIWWLNLIAAACLCISYLAPFVSPESFWFIAFFGLAYPVLLLINLVFFFYWILVLNVRVLLSMLVIVAGWAHVQSLVQFNFSSSSASDSSQIKVMSYNVRLFDLYNWSHNTQTRNKMFNVIADEGPDIMCLQEFYLDDSGEFPTLDTLILFQKAKNYHAEYTTNLRGKHHWGIATFTKYPIINKGKILFETESNNICIYTDILKGTDTLRIYNLHLQSVHMDNADYKLMDSLEANKKGDLESSRNLMRRLKKAFIKRAAQVDLVAESINKCNYSMIVCGDFNDTPNSYVYHMLSSKLEDTFVESGYGLGRTYDRRLTSVRIDYILKTPDIQSFETHTIKESYSDHYPLISYLKIKNK